MCDAFTAQDLKMLELYPQYIYGQRYALILALTRKERVVPQLNGNPLSLPMISVEIIECELVKQLRSEVWLLFLYFSVN